MWVWTVWYNLVARVMSSGTVYASAIHVLGPRKPKARYSNTESNDVREDFEHAVVEVKEGGAS